jgi:hypothetical protein
LPLSFPCHQGLIAPFWRNRPAHLDVLALWIGAGMPDVVDALTAPFRGGLGQWLGHSLVGLAVCTPLGLLLTELTILVTKNAARPPTTRAAPIRRFRAWLYSWHTARDQRGVRRMLVMGWSVLLGAFSHLVFDFFSHAYFLWLFPWYTRVRLFPAWWYVEWGHIPLPGYPNPYPFSPHLLVWMTLNVLGLILFVRAIRPDRRGPDQPKTSRRRSQ